jgi:hypothetical protein
VQGEHRIQEMPGGKPGEVVRGDESDPLRPAEEFRVVPLEERLLSRGEGNPQTRAPTEERGKEGVQGNIPFRCSTWNKAQRSRPSAVKLRLLAFQIDREDGDI